MINIKARLKNKTFLVLFIPMALAFIYQLLAMVGIVPHIAQGEIEGLLMMGVDLLALLGIVVDPTTKGVGDSERALTYTEPN